MATTQELIKRNSEISAQTSPTTTSNINMDAYNTARTDAINQMYDAKRAAREQELKAAYEQNLSAQQAAQDKIAPQYQTAANDLAVQYERNRQNFNRQAAASGINTGAASQAALARNSEYQRDFGNLRASESEAQAEAERKKADLLTNYQSGVAASLAENDYQRAAALLDEYNNGQQRNLQQAQTLAGYGDFSGFAKLYGQDAANIMQSLWLAQNPELAYMTGRITEAQRDNLSNGRPLNYGLDASGNRIATAGAGGNVNSDYINAYRKAAAAGVSGADAAIKYFPGWRNQDWVVQYANNLGL